MTVMFVGRTCGSRSVFQSTALMSVSSSSVRFLMKTGLPRHLVESGKYDTNTDVRRAAQSSKGRTSMTVKAGGNRAQGTRQLARLAVGASRVSSTSTASTASFPIQASLAGCAPASRLIVPTDKHYIQYMRLVRPRWRPLSCSKFNFFFQRLPPSSSAEAATPHLPHRTSFGACSAPKPCSPAPAPAPLSHRDPTLIHGQSKDALCSQTAS